MNKTIIINMNGIIFHIEEDAYEQLKNYMSSVKRHFAYTADSDEIVTDIENRIAEMFTEILAAEKKQVIVVKDVELVISQMGSVADFESAHQDEEAFIHTSAGRSEKRLYRDGDDRVIGGVCSGIGHYFDISSKWIRLAFLVAILFFGTGLWLYLILWIIMPKAKSRAEKMAMKGEKLNLQNFKRNFDEEIEALKGTPAISRAGGFLHDLFSHLGKFIVGLARILLKIVCVFIILGGLAAAVGIFVLLLILMGNTSMDSSEIFEGINMVNPEYRSAIFFSAFVVTIIPLAALVLFAVRILFNHTIITRTGVFAMLIIWLTGAGVGIFYGARVASNFAEEATFSQTIDLKPSKYYVLDLSDSRIFTHEDSLKYDLKPGSDVNVINGRSNRINVANVDIFIEEAKEGEKPSLTKKFRSSGPNFDAALRSAQRIGYQFTEKDSLLTFGWGGYIDHRELWREQRISLTLRVPKNTVLRIDRDLDDYIRGYSLSHCVPEGSDWKTPSDWVMGEDGLKCAIDSLNKEKKDTDR